MHSADCSPPLNPKDMGFDSNVLRYYPATFVYQGHFLTCGGGLTSDDTEATRDCHYYSLTQGVSVDKHEVGPLRLERKFAGSSYLNGR